MAIKTLPGDVMQRSPEDLERFKREIRLARKITHRNVLRTYDYGEAEGVYFISMEYVRGYTLAELLEEAPDHRMAPRVAMGIARQICRGLQAAHEQGIIHRDIKPQNVLIDHKGEVKLMDFGIARMAEAKEGMTQAGLIVGTPHYMSPEQVQGKQLDRAQRRLFDGRDAVRDARRRRSRSTSSSLTGVLTAHITEKAKPADRAAPRDRPRRQRDRDALPGEEPEGSLRRRRRAAGRPRPRADADGRAGGGVRSRRRPAGRSGGVSPPPTSSTTSTSSPSPARAPAASSFSTSSGHAPGVLEQGSSRCPCQRALRSSPPALSVGVGGSLSVILERFCLPKQ